MKEITDLLFETLCNKILNQGMDLCELTNKTDNKIYLAEYNDDELYFILSGTIALDLSGGLNKSKSSSFIIARNIETDIVGTIDGKHIRRIVDFTTTDDFLCELYNLFQQINSEKKDTIDNDENFKELKKIYQRHKSMASLIRVNLKKYEDETLFDFINRLASDRMRDAYDYVKAFEEIDSHLSFIILEIFWNNNKIGGGDKVYKILYDKLCKRVG